MVKYLIYYYRYGSSKDKEWTCMYRDQSLGRLIQKANMRDFNSRTSWPLSCLVSVSISTN